MCKDNCSDDNIPLDNAASENDEGEHEVNFITLFSSHRQFFILLYSIVYLGCGVDYLGGVFSNKGFTVYIFIKKNK
jgi:hypothetical protein